MAQKSDKDSYSKKEARRRFEAALRGSRNVGPQPMKTLAGKRPASERATGTGARKRRLPRQ